MTKGMAIPTMTQQVEQLVIAQLKQQTGKAPASVTIVFYGSSLAIKLYEVLSPTELAMLRCPEGAERVQEVQHRFFSNTFSVLREEIKRIMGLHIEEGSTEIQATTGTVIHTLGTTNIEHKIMSAQMVSWDSWSGS